MPILCIDEIDDPRVVAYRNLPHSRLARDSDLFVVEGAWLVERLLASDFEVVSLFVEPARADQFASEVEADVPVYVADRALLQEVVGFRFHRCVLACGRRRTTRPPDTLLAALPVDALVVVLQAVHDPENLGGVLRNCAAFGVDIVVLGPDLADAYSRRTLRVSMGTALKLSVLEAEDLGAVVAVLRDRHGFELVASVLDASATPLEAVRCGRRTALLFGNEAHGLCADLVDRCDRRVTIPLRLGTDSLNVAVASGVFLYEFTRGQPGLSIIRY